MHKSDSDAAPAPAATSSQAIARRYRTRRYRYASGLALLALGMIIGGMVARYWFGNEALRQYDVLKSQMQMQINQVRADLATARAQNDALQGQLMIEESTRKGLETSLQTAQAEVAHLREQLAFFDQLLPPGPKGAVSIRALEIQPLGPTLQYKVLLMRNTQDDALFKGRMQFVAKGLRDGKPAKETLQPVRVPGGAAVAPVSEVSDGLELDFDEFQRGSGILSIPPGFTPQTITLNVLEGDTLRVSRSVNLPAAD